MATKEVRNPPHPGAVLRERCVEPLGLTVSETAKALAGRRKALPAILNECAGICPEMAVRLSIALRALAEIWLKQQLQYDL